MLCLHMNCHMFLYKLNHTLHIYLQILRLFQNNYQHNPYGSLLYMCLRMHYYMRLCSLHHSQYYNQCTRLYKYPDMFQHMHSCSRLYSLHMLQYTVQSIYQNIQSMYWRMMLRTIQRTMIYILIYQHTLEIFEVLPYLMH